MKSTTKLLGIFSQFLFDYNNDDDDDDDDSFRERTVNFKSE